MTRPRKSNPEPTPVDDVRAAREKIAAQHAGDLRGHRLETNRQFEALRAKLNLKVIPAPTTGPTRNATG